MARQALSIQGKVYLALSIIFLLVLVVVVNIAIDAERELSRDMVHSQLKDRASNYLDTMNLLMVSGAMGNREMVRKKMLSDENITEARMLRNERVDKLYGKGYPHEYAQDELDRRALAGEEIYYQKDDDNGHTITFVTPVIAEEDYRGTNCLACHQAEQGDVLGAIRITYNMDELDAVIQRNMLTMSLAQALLFVVALVLLSLLLRRVIISPVKQMHSTLENMERESDLTHRVEIHSQDEIGLAGLALNKMISRFSESLNEVVKAATELESSADRIDKSSRQSLDAVDLQRQETDQVHTLIERLHESIHGVQYNAERSAEASQSAIEIAHSGVAKTDQASATIEQMNVAISTTATVVSSLDERSVNVGNVLSVIKGIAEQTNLLALNAAIEAARAGESGRGFAVVADEVRTLSQRTHESAQEIEDMIVQLQDEARKAVSATTEAQSTSESGMQQVREAASALHSMVKHVDEMARLNQETLERMSEQITVGKEVATSIETISEHSVNTTQSASHTTDIAGRLVDVANYLATLVKRFKL
ncbi:methyl-accepting chemotaxis protein [Bacterioplanes sanyensis]|uniref:Methyl-accepting chemotaxis protein n=1 Tax=Bacterioplanes sanyensis TaxID=1249553 RepID=A0A222FM40_9GAMM|nr:methyl-accepting chemotaxis protein [Bacterioplanes sanyensis]ASP40078.1 methyl-accepting chemotaxis protein [Bacterioplanes sanyensis]